MCLFSQNFPALSTAWEGAKTEKKKTEVAKRTQSPLSCGDAAHGSRTVRHKDVLIRKLVLLPGH